MGIAPEDISTAGAETKEVAATAGPAKTSFLSKVGRVMLWIALGFAGFVLNEALTWARDLAMHKPDYLQQLGKEQAQQFDEIKASLGQLGSSIRSGDRKAYEQVRDSLSSIEHTNSSLIQQLVLAKQENETLSKVAGEKAGVSGGYDFILAEGSGIRVDPTTIVGLENVSNSAHVNLTAVGTEQNRSYFLQPGESIAYKNHEGAACKVSLVSLNKASIGTASFAVACS